jgi:hypothetical protein
MYPWEFCVACILWLVQEYVNDTSDQSIDNSAPTQLALPNKHKCAEEGHKYHSNIPLPCLQLGKLNHLNISRDISVLSHPDFKNSDY